MAFEYVLDFETTARRVYDIKTRKLRPDLSETWVCAWAFIPVMPDPDPEHITRGRSIDEAMGHIHKTAHEILKAQAAKRRRTVKVNVFTHNLKFDGDFIMWWLLHGHGTITNEVRENVLYSFTALWHGIEVTFRDSMKIFPESAEKIGLLYGIPKLKGSWDYEKYREIDTPVSVDEWEYVDHDVMIISRALADYRSRGYHENTQAAIAYNNRLKTTYPRFRKDWIRKIKDTDPERFRAAFPYDIRPLEFALHKHLALGYFGGISYLNPFYANRMLYRIYSFDVHSMYPDKMANYPLPVGHPTIIKNPTQAEALRMIKSYNCVMVDIKGLTVRLKSREHFPTLMFPTLRNGAVRMEGKVIKCRNEDVTLTGIDVRIMDSEYEWTGEIIQIYLFRSKKGQYKDFVEYWMKQKQEADHVLNDKNASEEAKQAAKVQRQIAKVMMNSSYGKDGTKLLREIKSTYLDPETDLLDQSTTVEVAAIEYYIPTAIFITAWARWQLWNAVRLVRPYFVYCDTDSIKVTEEGYRILMSFPEFHVDEYELGAWGYEGCYDVAKFVRQKTYWYRQGEKEKYIVCGAPDDIKYNMTIDKFEPGMKIDLDTIHASINPETGKSRQGKLLPVRCRGGVILEETGFQISKVDNWDELSGRNMPIDYRLLEKVLKEE